MKSRFKNVYWHPGISKWTGKVKVNYKSHHLGSFADENDAHQAVLLFKIEHRMLNVRGEMPSITEAFEYRDGALFAKFAASSVKVGDAVGSVCKTHGYVMVGHAGHLLRAHHIVWQMFNGPVPQGMETDHVNGDRSDNRIENLRVVSKTENMRNRATPCNNTTGEIGVQKRPNGKYIAKVAGRQVGTFATIEEASSARRAASLASGFHPNHGRNHHASHP
jgi:hypothetical protein